MTIGTVHKVFPIFNKILNYLAGTAYLTNHLKTLKRGQGVGLGVTINYTTETVKLSQHTPAGFFGKESKSSPIGELSFNDPVLKGCKANIIKLGKLVTKEGVDTVRTSHHKSGAADGIGFSYKHDDTNHSYFLDSDTGDWIDTTYSGGYKSMTHFVSAVENNDLEQIKVELIKIIKYFYHKPKEIESAISFARSNSNFDFDNHKEASFDKSSKGEEFDSEYLNLFDNFSKKRYQKVVRLIPKWNVEDSDFNKFLKNSDVETSKESDPKQLKRDVEDYNRKVIKKNKRVHAAIGATVGGGLGYGIGHLSTRAIGKKISELKSKKTLTASEKVLLKKLTRKRALIKGGSMVVGAVGGGLAGRSLGDKSDRGLIRSSSHSHIDTTYSMKKEILINSDSSLFTILRKLHAYNNRYVRNPISATTTVELYLKVKRTASGYVLTDIDNLSMFDHPGQGGDGVDPSLIPASLWDKFFKEIKLRPSNSVSLASMDLFSIGEGGKATFEIFIDSGRDSLTLKGKTSDIKRIIDGGKTSLKNKTYSMKKERAVKVAKPTRKAESRSLEKYNKLRKLVRFFKLKKELSAAGFPETFNAGHQARLTKYEAKMKKARKLAAPELIKKNRQAIRSRNKGGGVGSKLSRLK